MSTETPSASHSEASHSHDKPHVGLYWGIGIALIVLTVVTVGIAYFIHIPVFATALAVCLVIATVKSSLVAAVFMHLIGEKKVIWWTLFLCALFFVFLIVLPSITTHSNVGKHIAPYVKMTDEHAAHGTEAEKAPGAAGHEAEAPAH